MGMHREADLIEQQAKAIKGGGGPGPGPGPAGAPSHQQVMLNV